MKKIAVRLLTLAENLWLDMRYAGTSLRGRKATRYSSEGAYDTGNSEYRALRQMFADRIKPDDVLVDVGCGRGRVIAFWLSLGLKNKLVGLELDPEIASETRRRFKKYANVSIIEGDAVQNLPPDASLIYLYNPFAPEVMQRFKERAAELFRDKTVTIIYYCPNHLPALGDAAWSGKLYRIPGLPHPYAVITSNVSSAPEQK